MTEATEHPEDEMSKCSHCNQDGHNIRTCPLRDVEKGPWFQNPEDRQHTKIVDEEEWPGGPVTEQEVPCDCQHFSAGEKHYDFSDVD
jgi:hypothetical protein